MSAVFLIGEKDMTRQVAFSKVFPAGCLLVLALLSAAACQPFQPAATSSLQWSVTAETAPVYVSAICTLMGQPSRSSVPAGRPVTLIWGWSAATEQQIREYLEAATVKVTFDGIERPGKQQGGFPYDDSAKVYRAVWMAEVGIPGPGDHTITYRLTFTVKVFDGFAYYGPGTKNEKQEDTCEVTVK
jgi:hypothetical protein